PRIGRHARVGHHDHFAAAAHDALGDVVEEVVHLGMGQLAVRDGTARRVEATGYALVGVDQQGGDAAFDRAPRHLGEVAVALFAGVGDMVAVDQLLQPGEIGRLDHAPGLFAE